MDLEVSVLTATVATTLVRQMTTDGWERVHSALGAWWRRARPGTAEGSTVDAHLARSRATALDARKSGDSGAEQLLVDEWQVRLGAVLADRPQVADELRRLLAEWQGSAPAAAAAASGGGLGVGVGPDQAVQVQVQVQAVQTPAESARIDMKMQAPPGHGRMTFTGRDVHLVDPD